MTDSIKGVKILCLGDLGWSEERKCDLRYFLHHPGSEFVHAGLREQRHAMDRGLSLEQAISKFRAGFYDVVVAGLIPRPFPNPRKNLTHRVANLARAALTPALALRALAVERSLSIFSPRLVVLDLEDRPIIDNRRFHAAALSQLYFKRELPQNPANSFLYTTDKNEDNGNIPRQAFFASILPKLRPISIGVEPSILAKGLKQKEEKSSDVFFAGRVENRPNRPAGLANLLRLREEGFRIDIPEIKISRPEFLTRCARALTVWSPEGFGYDCTRTYEAAAMGSAPLLQYPTIHRHAPLVDGVHALYYGIEGDHLYQVLRARLQEPAGLHQIGRQAQDHTARHHAFDKLADYVIETTLNQFRGK
ncbi:MAG: glycosyltransferase [Verrucomicrobiales bacterium]